MPKTVLVATSGGHLMQLHTLSRRMSFEEAPIWVTVDSAQSRSLLRDEEVIYLPYSPPRDVIGTIRNSQIVSRNLRGVDIDKFVSTGAGIALACIPSAYLHLAKFTYIESATRVSGLSVTGRVMSLLPAVTRYVQYPHLVNKKWKFDFSVFDEFDVQPVDKTDVLERLNVFVTVGANMSYGFSRLMKAVENTAPDDANVFVQYGPTDMSDFNLEGTPSLSASEIDKRIEWADVVISHAGTGSALSALMRGKMPILVPRRFDMGEHIDDHQTDLADFLGERGLAIIKSPETLAYEDLLNASRSRIAIRADVSRIGPF